MMRIGHYGAAMVAYIPVLLLCSSHTALSIVGLAGIFLGARLPDLDQRVPFVPHRGPTHTVWFAIMVGLLAVGIGHSIGPTVSLVDLVPVGIVPGLGVLSHLVADAMTPAGVRPLWPVSDRLVSANLVRAENGFANQALFVVGLLAVGIVLATGPASV